MMKCTKHICWESGFRSLNQSEFELELFWARLGSVYEDRPSRLASLVQSYRYIKVSYVTYVAFLAVALLPDPEVGAIVTYVCRSLRPSGRHSQILFVARPI
jgi:hypothetical protein